MSHRSCCGCNDENALNYNPESVKRRICFYYLAEITSIMFTDGIVEFNSDFWYGISYTTFRLQNGSYSSENNPTPY